MTTLNVKNFLNYEDIPHYFIWYYISSKTGKKTPIGEKNNENIEAVISKKILIRQDLHHNAKKLMESLYDSNLTQKNPHPYKRYVPCF